MSKTPDAVTFVRRHRDVMEKARKNIEQAQQRQKKYADSKRIDTEFEVGDLVMIDAGFIKLAIKKKLKKLTQKYIGPYPICRKLSELNYEVELPKKYKIHNVFHIEKLKKYVSNGEELKLPEPDIINDVEEYEVEQILDQKKVRGKEYFLVKWKNYTHEHDSWEPVKNLENASEALEDFNRRR